MSDIDRVFARLGGGQTGAGPQRELRRIPQKGGPKGGSAARVVEVVRVSNGHAAEPVAAPRRSDVRVRSATWDDGFPARTAAPRLPEAPTAPPEEPREAVTHVMPAWTRTEAEPEPAPAVAEEPALPAPPKAPRRAAERRVADPFDADDDGANCLRCGYAVQPNRERRGLLTCADCG